MVILRMLFMLFWSPIDFRGRGVTGYYWLMKESYIIVGILPYQPIQFTFIHIDRPS